jgi:1,4-dihydroxy-2-naphthoyl-CoA hydrolase
MARTYHRTIHFADTDAAGVVYFANFLRICHEAYEESLASSGINLSEFFKGHDVLIPVARSEADYKRPLVCGERIRVDLAPRVLSENSFEIVYEIYKLGDAEKLAARCRTEHVCVSILKRTRQAVPPALADWLRASA